MTLLRKHMADQPVTLATAKTPPTYQTMIGANERLPEDQKLDYILIVTPNLVHYDPEMKAMKAGIAVFCEKPLCLNLKEAMATVFVNGIPSTASLLEISAPVATSQPVLVMEKSAPASVRLHWPTNVSGFTLQSNTNLATTNWTTVSPLPGPTGTNIVLTNLPAGDQRFYRLFKP